jgi:hypothetical protein
MFALLAVSAHAGFWDRSARVDHSVGLSLVVNLGPAEDRARIGVAADVLIERFWADRPYWADEPVNRAAPLLTLAAHVGWTHPVVWSEVTGVAGPMTPWQVGDFGFTPLIGAQVGLGLQLATDGSAGPLGVATALGPRSEARIEITRWSGGWHAQRLLLGPRLSLDCCGYFL